MLFSNHFPFDCFVSHIIPVSTASEVCRGKEEKLIYVIDEFWFVIIFLKLLLICKRRINTISPISVLRSRI